MKPFSPPTVQYAAAISLALLFAPCPAHAVPDTLWVDNTNGSAGAGTYQNPYRSISVALNSFTGGSNKLILVKTGTGIYRETVKIDPPDSGSVSQPLTIKPYSGQVVIDGSEVQTTWTQHSGSIYRGKVASDTLPVPPATVNQVYMNGFPYLAVADTNVANLAAGRCVYVRRTDSVYVNLGSHTYTSGDTGFISLRKTVQNAGASNVTIDGFTIWHANDDGIGITSFAVRNVHITNCIVAFSQSQGLMFSRFPSHHCTIDYCDFRYNISHGIFLVDTLSDCVVANNISAWNNDPTVDRGGANGIRIGEHSTTRANDTTYVTNTIVERNRVWGNEDTGIEYRVNAVLSRYNKSWNNYDHGYDHLYCVGVRHVADLSWGNARSGMSFESTTWKDTLYNCIVANNARDTQRKDYEIELDCGNCTGAEPMRGFFSDHNVIWRSNSEPADSVVIAVGNIHETPQTGNSGCDTYGTCYGRNQLARFQTDYATKGLEAHSKGTEPTVVDSSAIVANFIPVSSSSAIDAASTNVGGYQSTDLRGFARHDVASVSNTGVGSPTYADIGPYEFDSPPGKPLVSVGIGYDNSVICWTARGDDADIGTPYTYTIYDGQYYLAGGTPQGPGNSEIVYAYLNPCTSHSITVMIHDNTANNQEVTSDVIYAYGDCDPYSVASCDGYLRSEEESRMKGAGEIDVPLSLSLPENPMKGMGTVKYGIPRALNGARFELALFDVIGRRAATVAGGIAKAGRHAEALRFVSESGNPLRSGVYFMRLCVNNEIIRRTVILTR